MLTRQQSRQFDQFVIRQLKIPGLVLMENAGRGCAEVLLQAHAGLTNRPRSAVVLCGPGNNGGDGFVIARHLWNAGFEVQVVTSRPPESYTGDAQVMIESLWRLPIRLIQFEQGISDRLAQQVIARVGRKPATWVIDALLGTGATGALRAPMNQMVAIANSAEAIRLAVDVPSGFDCDSGDFTDPTFHADLTCSLIDRKSGFGNQAAAEVLGDVRVVQIGVSTDQVQRMLQHAIEQDAA